MSRFPLLIVALMFAGVIASVVVVNGRPGADPSGKDAMIPALAVVIVGMLAIPIVLFALYQAVKVMRPGGRLDQGYAAADAMMEPLGLNGIERPQWVPMPYATGDVHSTVIGPTVLGGARHGRDVVVVLQGGDSQVAVACDSPAFRLKGADGLLRAGEDVPPAVIGAIGTLVPAAVWSSARVEGGDGRILVTRRRGGQKRWSHDLWLAERLADAVSGRA